MGTAAACHPQSTGDCRSLGTRGARGRLCTIKLVCGGWESPKGRRAGDARAPQENKPGSIHPPALSTHQTPNGIPAPRARDRGVTFSFC